jgi:hypothetical protein
MREARCAGHEAVDTEAKVNASEVEDRARQQAAASEQDRRARNLADHEESLCPASAIPGASRRADTQEMLHVATHHEARGNDADEHRGRDRHEGHEREDPGVDPIVHPFGSQ